MRQWGNEAMSTRLPPLQTAAVMWEGREARLDHRRER
jgi:hypothetical protein